MRDAFGGAFMIKIFIVFIIIYICFIAVALNYAKAFKAKNKIIDYLESEEIMDLNNLEGREEAALEEFFETEILGNMNYKINTENMCDGINQYDELGRRVAICSNIGIVIRQIKAIDELNETDEIDTDEIDIYYPAKQTKGAYYTVSTYIGWSGGFINNILALDNKSNTEDTISGYWKISGQTRLIINEN